MLVAHHRFTVGGYHRMLEAGVFAEDDRVELIRGEVFDMTPLGRRHVACVNRLTRRLIGLVGDQAVVSIQNPVQLGVLSEPEPDVAVLAPRQDFYESRLPQADDVWLLVEVADTSLPFDRRVKLPLYAEQGIPEVWLVDLVKDRIEVYREPAGSTYQKTRTLVAGDTLDMLRLQDVSLPESDLI